MKIYRKNFEIRRTAMHMGTPALMDLILYQKRSLGKNYVKEAIWVQKEYNNTGTYMPLKQLRQVIEKTIEAILNKPKFIQKVHKKTLEYSKNYFQYAKSLENKDYKNLTNNQLWKIYDKLDKMFMDEHGTAITTTWLVDSDGEDFTKLLINKLKDKIKANQLNISASEAFNILSSPEKSSLAIKEEIESLEVLQLIKNNTKAKKLFRKKNVKKIESDLDKLDNKLKRKIKHHYKKWHWLPYTYIGPAYDLDFYLKAWSGLIREKIKPQIHIKKLKEQPKNVKKRKTELIKKLKLSSQEKIYYDIAAEVIHLKSYRKDVWFYGNFVLEKIHKEIARRLNLSLKQVRFIGNWEMKKALKKNYFSPKILNERFKFCIYYQTLNKNVIYQGRKAKNFLKSKKFEKEKIVKTDKFSGTSACKGKSQGIVKIINEPADMSKMKKGDIMVAITTFPALVPAMKKASALVTDTGGITCHAAIVSREMNIPCVIGTKIATKILKDGDKVRVNANKGIIKKI